jgi:hypothetical protein
MEENNKATLSLRAAYAFGIERGLEQHITEIRDMVIEWDYLIHILSASRLHR